MREQQLQDLHMKSGRRCPLQVLAALLQHLAEQIAEYMCFQIEAGADCVQLFDSWGGQLPPSVSSLVYAYILTTPHRVRTYLPRLTVYLNCSTRGAANYHPQCAALYTHTYIPRLAVYSKAAVLLLRTPSRCCLQNGRARMHTSWWK